MTFAEVVGHEDIKAKLAAQVNSGKVPQALLFAGNEGTGGLTLALALAQFLVCEKRSGVNADDGGLFGAAAPVEKIELKDACGVCPACNKAQKLIHPDIHFTFPVYKKDKGVGLSNEFISEWRAAVAQQPYMNLNDWMQFIEAENKQGNINVFECKEIIRHINLKSFESKYKVQIVWMAEVLRETGNVLLKLIEEPPPDTVFIFVVEQIDQVLATVLSRTQIVKLPPVKVDAIQQFLLQQKNISVENANKIARVSDGNMRMALQLSELETNEYQELLQQWFSTSARLLGNARAEASLSIQQISDNFQKMGRENQKGFLHYAGWYLREILMISQKLGSEKLYGAELSFAEKVATKMDVEKAKLLNSLFTNAAYHIERNANPKITLYSLSFRLCHVFNN